MAAGDNEKRKNGGAAESSAAAAESGKGGGGGRKENGNGGSETEDFAFDEPEDELEEFDEIGGDSNRIDPEVAVWDEDWDAAGWDDEDVNDEFIRRLQLELTNFKKEMVKSGKAAAASAAPTPTTTTTTNTTMTSSSSGGGGGAAAAANK